MDDAQSAASNTGGGGSDSEQSFDQVPIEIMISVGKAHPSVAELLQLKSNSVLPLDQRVDDPVELYVGTKLIARGELLELEGDDTGQLAVRLTEVAALKHGI